MGRYYVLRFFMQRLQNALFKIFVKFLRFCLEWTSGPNRPRPLSTIIVGSTSTADQLQVGSIFYTASQKTRQI